MPEPPPGGALPVFIATAAGIGRLRPAPGTWASLATVLAIGAALPLLARQSDPGLAIFLAGMAATILGLLACPAAIRRFRSPDPSSVVIDEVAGQCFAVSLIPGDILFARPWLALGAAFVAFRAFDILKPWPIDALERLPGGSGIMADDVAAGLLAGLCCAAILT